MDLHIYRGDERPRFDGTEEANPITTEIIRRALNSAARQMARAQDQAGTRAARRETPVPVVLTRFAAQNLYAPLRTVEPLPGVMRVNLRRDMDLGTLMPTLPVRALALASWRLEDQWVTAVRLTNTSAGWVTLDPRVLQGDFLTATFQHEALGPHGVPEDTTVLYLVTRGRGLAQSLLPAIHRFDLASAEAEVEVLDAGGVLVEQPAEVAGGSMSGADRQEHGGLRRRGSAGWLRRRRRRRSGWRACARTRPAMVASSRAPGRSPGG